VAPRCLRGVKQGRPAADNRYVVNTKGRQREQGKHFLTAAADAPSPELASGSRMTTRQLRKAMLGTTVAARNLVGPDVNETIARYASFGWEALEMAALRKTYSLTGGLFFHRHGITILFRRVSLEAVQPELLLASELRPLPVRLAPDPEFVPLRTAPAVART
jgi:hypothetical protein